MTPQAFIAKWHGNSLSEKAGAQSFFLDLCDLLGVAMPDAEILKRLLALNLARAR